MLFCKRSVRDSKRLHRPVRLSAATRGRQKSISAQLWIRIQEKGSILVPWMSPLKQERSPWSGRRPAPPVYTCHTGEALSLETGRTDVWVTTGPGNSLLVVVEDVKAPSSSHEPDKPAHVSSQRAQFSQVQPARRAGLRRGTRLRSGTRLRTVLTTVCRRQR